MPQIERVVDHTIQKHIIGVLIHTQFARFRDLKPPRTDTNLFSYHLKVLIRDGFIEKTPDGYSLSTGGLGYVDHVSLKKMNVRSQPKIITMLLIRDEAGRVLLQKRTKQPYIDTWTLPYGKTHISDSSIRSAALRETTEKIGIDPTDARHIGDAYIRVSKDGHHLSTTLAHLFAVTLSRVPEDGDDIVWLDEQSTATLPLAPAVPQLLQAVKVDDYFFTEIDVQWG